MVLQYTKATLFIPTFYRYIPFREWDTKPFTPNSHQIEQGGICIQIPKAVPTTKTVIHWENKTR